MSVSGTCTCRGQKRSIVGHCHWFVQDYGANEWWPADCEWTRYRSAHNELESSSEVADQDESSRSVNSDDEDIKLDSGCDGIREGRHFGGQDGGQDGELVGGWYGRRNRTRNSGLAGGRISGWDGAPRSSYRGTPVKLIFYWDKFCERCNVPDAADDGSHTAQAVHHNHQVFINGNSDSVGRGERSLDRGRMVLAAHRRRAPSTRRQRPHFVHGVARL